VTWLFSKKFTGQGTKASNKKLHKHCIRMAKRLKKKVNIEKNWSTPQEKAYREHLGEGKTEGESKKKQQKGKGRKIITPKGTHKQKCLNSKQGETGRKKQKKKATGRLTSREQVDPANQGEDEGDRKNNLNKGYRGKRGKAQDQKKANRRNPMGEKNLLR